jgi:hypothetical protein
LEKEVSEYKQKLALLEKEIQINKTAENKNKDENYSEVENLLEIIEKKQEGILKLSQENQNLKQENLSLKLDIDNLKEAEQQFIQKY